MDIFGAIVRMSNITFFFFHSKIIEIMGLVSHFIETVFNSESEILLVKTFIVHILKVVATYWPLVSFNYQRARRCDKALKSS